MLELLTIKLYDEYPLMSCVKGGREVVMISEFELANDEVKKKKCYTIILIKAPQKTFQIFKKGSFKKSWLEK